MKANAMRSRTWWRAIPIVGSAALVLLTASPARAQNSAIWVGGPGNWGVASNWNCVVNGSPTHCVPAPGYFAGIDGGQVNLDVNGSVNVLALGEASSGQLTISGTSLTATDVVFASGGITVSGGGQVNIANHGLIMGSPLGAASSLIVSGAASSLNLQGSALELQGEGVDTATFQTGATINGTGDSRILVGVGDVVGTSLPVSGSSQLSLVGGAAATVSEIHVEGGPSNPASLTVSGVRSFINASNDLLLNVGTIDIADLASAQANSINLLDGQLTVESKASLQSSSFILIGHSAGIAPFIIDPNANATLTVQSGATGFAIGEMVLGQQSGTTGSLTVTGSGSSWKNSSAIFAGYGGTGNVSVFAGAMLTSAPDSESDGSGALIGFQAGSEGTVSVGGQGSQWVNDGQLTVGSSGHGTLEIFTGGTVTTPTAVIGDKTGSDGEVSVSGAAALWDVSNTLDIGNEAKGSLTIEDKGEVDSGDTSLGADSGGEGTVTMTDGIWKVSGDLKIADHDGSHATMDVQGNSIVTSNTASIGDEQHTIGKVTIGTGAKWDMTQNLAEGGLNVGEQGSGILEIAGRVDDREASIGGKSTGNGAVQVDRGGVWNNINDLNVGEEGSGSLGIDAGGRVTVGKDVDIASTGASSFGAATIDGAWIIQGDLSVGKSGSGNMTIENGGSVFNQNDGHVGEVAGSNGTVAVQGSGLQGKSFWQIGGDLTVGEGGTGTLHISNGGVVTSGSGVIGAVVGANGTVMIADTQSSWNVTGAGGTGILTIGAGGGTGTLNISNGGAVVSSSGLVGTGAGSNGTVLIAGTGSVWNATAPGGTGIITVGTGGATGLLKVAPGGSVVATSVVVGAGGTLAGTGVVGSVINAGGKITPTDGPGLMTITGNYVQNSGTLVFDIDGSLAGQFDQLLVLGSADFAGGTIEIKFGNGFQPLAGEDFDLITVNEGLLNRGVSVDISGLAPGLEFADVFTSKGFSLDFAPGTVNTPEPASLFLLALGLAGIAGIHNRITMRKRGSHE